MRAFWRGDPGLVTGAFAERFAGSSDLFRHHGRKPTASINYLASHDGFTLRDLVSYNERHNEANLENGSDGHTHNLSWNCGVEGPTDDRAVLELRARQLRNFLATLFLSQGVPMLLAGDEIGHSQSGNNNAYCQDNELTWIDWRLLECSPGLVRFVRRLADLRRSRLWLRRDTFLKGTRRKAGARDIAWLHPSGREMTDARLERRLAALPCAADDRRRGRARSARPATCSRSSTRTLRRWTSCCRRRRMATDWRMVLDTGPTRTARRSRSLCAAKKRCAWRRAARYCSNRSILVPAPDPLAARSVRRAPDTGYTSFPALAYDRGLVASSRSVRARNRIKTAADGNDRPSSQGSAHVWT